MQTQSCGRVLVDVHESDATGIVVRVVATGSIFRFTGPMAMTNYTAAMERNRWAMREYTCEMPTS